MNVIRFILFVLLAGVLNGSHAQTTQKSEADVQAESTFIEATRNKMIGRFDLAIDQYKEILKKQPGNDVIWYELANAYLMTKKPTEALDAIKQSITAKPNNIFYLQLQANIFHSIQDDAG